MVSATITSTIQPTLQATIPSAGSGSVVGAAIHFNGQPLVFNGTNLTYNKA